MKYICYDCKEEVPVEHFTADDGRILCAKCSKGVEPCSERIQRMIEEDRKKSSVVFI